MEEKYSDPWKRLLFCQNLLITSPVTLTACVAGGVRTRLDDQGFPKTQLCGTALEHLVLSRKGTGPDGAAQHTVKG